MDHPEPAPAGVAGTATASTVTTSGREELR